MSGSFWHAAYIRDWRKSGRSLRSPSYFAISVLLLAAYYASGKLGLRLVSLQPSASPVWPDTGIALAAFLLLGFRFWPAILISSFAIYMTTLGSVVPSIGIAIGNTIEGLLGAYLVNRYAGGLRFCRHAHSLFRFTLFAGLFSTIVGATVGVASLILGGFADWTDHSSLWITWWLADSVGAVLVTPVLVLWIVNPVPRWTYRKLMEAGILVISILLVGSIAFGEPTFPVIKNYPLEFLCIPILIVTAFRFGEREASTAALLLSGMALWGTINGYGPFIRETRNESLLLLQVFMGVVSVMTISVATVVSERKRVEKRLRKAQKDLARQAASDPLTGLANYRRLVNAFQSEVGRSQRTGRPFSMVLFDLDGLKKINDAYGHLTGSRALYRMADVLRRRSREIDTAARYGGDEFALLLPETGADRARLAADRIAESLAKDIEQPLISVSFGISVYPQAGESFDSVFRAADLALYSMKRERSGQNAIRT